ncbi:hypothetical protein TNCV_4961271 [Trichonephila clavipes]|uniref:Uncharacterized protein n=1 Tax=Trichonephila clavipes TaxID=2585209 RepID=A0A8X6SH70_TRICX|nr:hypothetical protein TNCV_4961271 [Trichonephila clavipes]
MYISYSARGIRNASSAVSPTSPGTARRRQQRRQPAVIVRKGTTRGSESPSRRSKSCNNLCTSLDPPTSESSPSKLYHSPTSEYSPCKHSHSPPVSAAPAPRPRPTPTPSTSQTSTQAINSTSNPPSTIAETLKQLREPKVVEIFQVLKQVIAICNSDMPLADRAIEVAALLQIDLPI